MVGLTNKSDYGHGARHVLKTRQGELVQRRIMVKICVRAHEEAKDMPQGHIECLIIMCYALPIAYHNTTTGEFWYYSAMIRANKRRSQKRYFPKISINLIKF